MHKFGQWQFSGIWITILNIEHWGKFAISLAAAVLTLGPGASTEREDQG